jgi:diguanylate cyclase (GGDEF)-like protein/PAS domain S-box-containing protein
MIRPDRRDDAEVDAGRRPDSVNGPTERHMEDRFRAVAEASFDVMYQLTPDDSILWVSPSAREAMGWDPADQVGRSLGDFVHPDDVGFVLDARQHPVDGVVTIDEFRCRRADGSYLWVSFRARVITDGSGRVVGWIAALHDIDDFVRSRAVLEQERERLRVTLDTLVDPHVVLESVRGDDGKIVDFVFVEANGAACQYMQMNSEDLLGVRLLSLFPGKSGSGMLALYADAVESGEQMVLDDYAYPNGSWQSERRYDIRAGRMGDDLSFTWRDVTDRHAEIEARIASEERYRMLAENVSDVVVLIGADDRYIWVSPSIRDTVGWEPSELIGKTLADFVHPDELGRVMLDVELAHREKVDYQEYRVRRRDGTYLWVSAVSKPIVDADGEYQGRVASLRDVAAQHEEFERFETSVESMLEPFAVFTAVRDATGTIVDLRHDYVNAAASALYGRPVDDIVGHAYLELFPASDAETERTYAWFREIIETGEAGMTVITFNLGSDPRYLELSAVRLADGLVVTARDRTAREEAETERRRRAEQLRAVLDSSPDGIMRVDSELRVEYVNRQVVQQSGRPSEDWVGRTLRELGYPEAAVSEWDEQATKVFKTGERADRLVAVERAGEGQWFEVIMAPEFEPDGSVAHVVATSRDITQRKLDQERLEELATHDPLTGLVNRSGLLDEITRSLGAGRRSGRATAVLMLDLDHFKYVNDSMGHGVGDELLRAVAGRIESIVRSGDLVARPGGDEFVIVMRELDDPVDAVRAARRLVHEFRSPFLVHDAELFSTASVGVALAMGIGPESTGADDLVREADTAMYLAKDEGRDRLSLFNEELRGAVTSRLSIEGELRRALERHELVVWYQPEIDLATGSMIAVEALLRWHHPSGELYTADRFVEIAEETGLILDIGDWVIREAFRQAATWEQARPDRSLTVRVNLSALQLTEGGLLAAIDEALSATGADPDRLCVEITETALLREAATVHQNLVGIRHRGIRIAIDDFGTGYASLAYLRQYPVDVLKIDRSFITHVMTDDFDRRLVAGVVALAQILGMKVTAEGVEQDDQAALLLQLGCGGAQGFLYSKAVPPEQIDTMFDATFPGA